MDATNIASPPRFRVFGRRGGSVAVAVGVAHLLNDAYASFLNPLLPRLMQNLGLSIALAASLAMTLSLASSLLQPAAGYLADRYGRKMFVVAGPLISGVFLSLIGLAPSAGVLALVLVLGGIGSAVFHPPGVAMSVRAAEGKGKGSGLRMSVFSFGGSAGFAVGPLLIVGLVSVVGLEAMWVAMIPAIVVSGLLLLVLPEDRPHPSASHPRSAMTVLKSLRGPLGVIFCISAIGAFVQRVFLTLSPIIVYQAGGSEAKGAVTLSVYLGAQVGGTLIGGMLTDRMDRSRLLAYLTALAVPAHLLALALPPGSSPALLFAACAGLLNMAMLPPIVVMAQEIVPESTAISSGIVMGLAWAAGSFGVLATGFFADFIGARSAAMISVPMLFVGSALAFHPALRGHRRPVYS